MGITVIVDCNECAVRDIACRDCVVTVLLGEPTMRERTEVRPDPRRRVTRIDQEEQDAIDALADIGLVPRLRLVRTRVPQVADQITAATDSCEPRRIS
ncbi:hypothetical protein FOY51_11560 [Antrihabitans cavernicola]|uniref:Uncharacterized protein n=1 Tax=Antrihabitans cavernicola TaxID=2495913 RepID=A0A5A7SCK8_9NOCA|nr:hypothetical protein [Spelaeibacter cavernicola]KAA0023109.1 hypothetical protein FOY51_11560 [Spelaeibacter cavernicola]